MTIIAQTRSPGAAESAWAHPASSQRSSRSYRQAQLALKMQLATGCPEQVSVFDDLGVYQLLSEVDTIGSVEVFIHRWLGELLDYDATRMVETLCCYLECGGNYDLTAKTLSLQHICAPGCNGFVMCPVTTSQPRHLVQPATRHPRLDDRAGHALTALTPSRHTPSRHVNPGLAQRRNGR
ncbi:MAG: hypothetical protein ACRDTH_19755 [Pseudonocardiaceae bacterium]